MPGWASKALRSVRWQQYCAAGDLETHKRRPASAGARPDIAPSAPHPTHRQLLVHAADISNPARPLRFCSRWGQKVHEEFFAQVSHDQH